MLATASRAGELWNLKWSDVDLKDGRLLLRETKNAEPRTVWVGGEALRLLAEHGKVRRLDDDRVFVSVTGKQYRYDKRFPAACEAASVKAFTFRGPRHYASLLTRSTDAAGMSNYRGVSVLHDPGVARYDLILNLAFENSAQIKLQIGTRGCNHDDPRLLEKRPMRYLHNCWYMAARASEVKLGTMLARRLLAQPVVLVRDLDSHVFAMHDRCPRAANMRLRRRGTNDAPGQVCLWRLALSLASSAVQDRLFRPHDAVTLPKSTTAETDHKVVKVSICSLSRRRLPAVQRAPQLDSRFAAQRNR